MRLISTNPYTNSVINELEEYSEAKVEKLLTQSVDAFGEWKRTTFEFRSSLMGKAAALLRNNVHEYAGIITSEMGKPINESVAEIIKCAWACEYYALNAQHFLIAEHVDTDADMSYIHYEPIGPVLGIMPWNFPFWQVFRFAVPTLMAGNTVLLKHASSVQLCASKIESIFTRAGFPSSVFRNLAVGSARVEKIIRHDSVRAVSLTGSEAAGRMVAAIAGSAVKKTLLELGGSNAFVVLADADLQKAVETGIKARFQNAGQSCISAKRFITDEKVSDQFVSLFVKKMNSLKMGDPSKEDTDLGPLANIQQAEKVEEQVKRSVEMGARVISGGSRNKAFYEPTLLIDVVPGMPLFDEEVFGPVVPVTVAKNTAEAIALANNTTFGLGVTLFTNDLDNAAKLVPEFKDGAVFINSLVKSDPRLPFGGTGRSGYGRELGVQGIKEFVNIKTVYFKKA
jgi:succinate-semialdehyde dehydrogenase / glutarate-semialdehyde dehydrogenase